MGNGNILYWKIIKNLDWGLGGLAPISPHLAPSNQVSHARQASCVFLKLIICHKQYASFSLTYGAHQSAGIFH